MESAKRRDGVDAYAELGVSPTATKAEIKRAFRRKAAKNHPDRGGSTTKMASLNQAYALLTDDNARAAYDRGETPRPEQSPEAKATEFLAGIWSQAVEEILKSEKDINILKAMETHIQKIMRAAESQIMVFKKQRRMIEKIQKKRLKASAKSTGSLEHVLIQKLEVIDRNMKLAQDNLDLGPLILEQLATYGWEGPDEAAPTIDRFAPFFTFSQ